LTTDKDKINVNNAALKYSVINSGYVYLAHASRMMIIMFLSMSAPISAHFIHPLTCTLYVFKV